MNPFEKLLMVLVPSMGLAAIMYFFTWYLPDVENGHFTENQRLQGTPYVRTVTTKFPIKKTYRNKLRNKTVAKKNNFRSRVKPSYSNISKPVKRSAYKQPQKQYDPYLEELKYYDNQRIQSDRRIYEKRRRALKQKKQHKKANSQQCIYYEKMKKQIRDRMRRGYKAWEYNRLEKKRKYWAKKYSDNCFGGYRYPR